MTAAHNPHHRPSADGTAVFPGCSCRWVADVGCDPVQVDAAHAGHVASFAAITAPELAAGDKVRFDGKSTWWLVRATAAGGRYAVCTAAIFGDVHYTVVDRLGGIRGAMNVIGHGMGIDTTSGPDRGIDRVVRMLEHRPDTELYPDADPDEWDGVGWGVSHRNRVPLRITAHRTDPATTRRAA